jgi:hypothetical protein
MTDLSSHITDDDLILHFYGEAPQHARVESHLAACAACQDEYARLNRVLALVDTADSFDPAEAPGPAFEREVWARLAPTLATHRASWLSRLFHRTPRWALAGGIATLVLAAFVAGRFTGDAPPAAVVADRDTGVAGRVLVVAVVDHLDRSQMVLMEVMNADVDSAVDLAGEQTLARELIAANRLYRQTATQTGDGGTSDVLDELERVLLEIANTPADATRDDLDALRARISSRGLLFKVRVVHSELLERERQTLLPGSQS